MNFLLSNYSPFRTSFKSFSDVFYEYFSKSTQVDIAVGYVTADSLAELHKLAEVNEKRIINLIIGMHYYDQFSQNEYNAAMKLNKFLRNENRGEVRLVTPFKFHGKLYSYSKDGQPIAGIIGSDNLSSITDSKTKAYEASVLLDDGDSAREMNSIIKNLVASSTDNIDALVIENFKKGSSPLENQEHVEKLSDNDRLKYMAARTDLKFNIPLKTAEKSNLNAFFGEGRKSSNGLIKPRHWYETEVIVSKTITSQAGYPKSRETAGSFDVITDDGWKFKCYVGGTNNKNFRSDGDLKILGRWLKGRLEEKGALQSGEPVIEETFRQYGRDNFSMTKTTFPNVWYLDFGVEK